MLPWLGITRSVNAGVLAVLTGGAIPGVRRSAGSCSRPPPASPSTATRSPFSRFAVGRGRFAAWRRRLQRRNRSRPVLNDSLEGPRAPLVEIEAAGHRFHPHL